MSVVDGNSTKPKKILVAGGAGFIGSNLVDVLMTQGHTVMVLDNFSTGRLQNVEHWLGHDRFSLVRHDVVNPLNPFTLQVDQIYHLASPASPPHYQADPIQTVKTNTVGTLNLLELASKVRARFLLASTSEVYGDPEVHPQPETYWGNVNSIGPRACYDEGKRVSETMCYAYADRVEVRVARIFNTFGPRMNPNDGRVVSNFIVQALRGEALTVYGDGHQTRSFQYVSDLVAGLIQLMNSDETRPVNLGNPEEISVGDFAEKIRSLISQDSPILFLPAAVDDPRNRKPDISRAKTSLGWEPVVSTATGLEYTVQYFRQQLFPHSSSNV